MESLKGKRLLVISSDGSDIEFVNAAKEMGIHVTCCDRYSDWSVSPAKALADDAWTMDYSDTEAVAKKCKEAGIDGVIAGYGEDRVTAACKISEAIGAPFYATEAQIDFTRNKRLFKEACERNGVLTPKEYCSKLPMSTEDLAKIEYPVIVKPSDNGGRKGITICENEEQLLEAIKYAEENSKNGEIVIEQYLTGIELLSVYTMVDGEISLSCLNDKYVSAEGSGASKLCDFVITPSTYFDKYLKDTDSGIKAVLKEMGAKNGMANFQFIANKDGIYAFEMGYRVNGNNDFKVIRKYNDIDFMKMLISYSVSGKMGDSLEKDNPRFKEYFCTFITHLKPGTIGKIDTEKLADIKNIDDISIWKKPGDVIMATGTNAHKAGMIKFSAKTIDEVIDVVYDIKKKIVIEDTDGNDMFLTNFNPERIRS